MEEETLSPRDRNKSAEPSPRPTQALSSDEAPASEVSVPTVVTNSSFAEDEADSAAKQLPEKPV